MKLECEIREPQTAEEINAIASLWTTTFRDIATHTDQDLDRWFKLDEWRASALERLAGNPSNELSLVAVQNEIVLGAITGFRKQASDSIFSLEIMAVDKNFRKNGVGTALVQNLIRFCTARQIKAIHFNTAELPAQGGAVGFWDRVACDAPVIKIGQAIYEDGEEGENGVYYKIQLRGKTWT